MADVNEIYTFINSIAPFDTQFDWDNAGLLVGNGKWAVHKVGLALDATVQVIEDAVKCGCDLFVTHHPIIFTPLRKVDFSSPVAYAVRNNLPIICAHTNLDIAPEGVNTALANKLGLTEIRNVEVNGEVLWVGNTPETNAADFSKLIADKLNTAVRYSDAGNTIRTVAVCGGAGGEYMYNAAEAGIDAYVTGEVHHHEYLDSERLGISVFAAGHFETENPVIEILAKQITDGTGVETTVIEQKKPTSFTGD